jgi:hypothetical protein
MKKLLTIALLAASTAAFAQGIIGPKVGLNISSFKDTKIPDGGKATEFKSLLTPTLGVVFNARLGDIISLRPEVLFVQRGYQLEVAGKTSTTRLSYAEIPLNVVGCIPAGPGKVEISAGPAAGYMFGGKRKTDGADDVTIKGEDFPKTPEKNTAYVNYLNVSLNFGVGYNWKGLIFQVGYNLGLSNFNPHYEDRDSQAEKDRGKDVTKASAVTFGSTYLFGGKDVE